MNPNLNAIYEALNFRHACKIFDETRQIPPCEMKAILESAMMAPSSMGLEPTRLEIIQTPALRASLRKLCWDQPQITTASAVVLLKNLVADVNVSELGGTAYMEQMSHRRGKTDAERAKWLEVVRGFLASKEKDGESVSNWTAKQGYITAGFMMLSAAMLGVDSCAIEGFETRAVEDLLGIDRFKERANLILCFGYRVREQQPRYRLSKDELISYR